MKRKKKAKCCDDSCQIVASDFSLDERRLQDEAEEFNELGILSKEMLESEFEAFRIFSAPEESLTDDEKKERQIVEAYSSSIPRFKKLYVDVGGYKRKISRHLIFELLIHTYGMTEKVAEILGVSVSLIEDVIHADPKLFSIVEHYEARLKRAAESQLQKLISSGHFGAIKFYLERKGGYEKEPAVSVSQTITETTVDIETAEAHMSAVLQTMLKNDASLKKIEHLADTVSVKDDTDEMLNSLDSLKKSMSEKAKDDAEEAFNRSSLASLTPEFIENLKKVSSDDI